MRWQNAEGYWKLASIDDRVRQANNKINDKGWEFRMGWSWLPGHGMPWGNFPMISFLPHCLK